MHLAHHTSLFRSRQKRSRGPVHLAGSVFIAFTLALLLTAAGAAAALVPMASGDNDTGQLGTGTTESIRYPPAPIVGLPASPLVKVVGGYNFTVALVADGTVWAWGGNNVGQLGTGGTTPSTVPVLVAGLDGVVDVAAGGYTTIAARHDGTVWAWGNNVQGQCGNGTTASPLLQPTQVLDADDPTGRLTGARAVAMASNVGFALKEDGTVRSWGSGMGGLLGIGIQANRYTAVPVVDLAGVTAIAAGSGHALARKEDGTVWSWGANWYGQIGDGRYGSSFMRLAPVQVIDAGDATGFLTGVTAVAAGDGHSVALKGDGTVRTWGRNHYAALGTPPPTYESQVPVVVVAPLGTDGPLTGVVSVATGYRHNLAIRDDGSAWGWGDNGAAQLGRSPAFWKAYYPVQIFPPATDATAGTVLVGASGNSSFFVVDVFNRPPVANAGDDRLASLASNAYLDGSASYDPDPGDYVLFAWETVSQPAGSAAVLFGANSPTPHFVADVPGTYVFRLVVTDSKGATSESDEVSVSTRNVPPVADPGPDQTTTRNVPVLLDGTGSSDPDPGDTLSFSWQLASAPAGSAAALDGASGPNPSFVPDLPGDYRVVLVVTDTSGAASSPDEVIVHAFNQQPVADAGPDQSVLLLGTVVILDGSGSWDGDSDALVHAWEFVSAPEGSAAALSDPAAVSPTFVADVNGEYRLQLMVGDPWDSGAPDIVVVSFDNVQPVADAGPNLSVTEGETVSLDGSGSHDANLDPLTFSWNLAQAPEGSLAVLDDPASARPSFAADLPGAYVVTLVVSDGIAESEMSSTTVTAVTTSDALLALLQELFRRINALADEDFKNPKMRHAMTNKVNTAISQVTSGAYQGLLNHLGNDLLGKTDGCAVQGAADKSDWIVSCPAQETIDPLIAEALVLIDRLLE